MLLQRPFAALGPSLDGSVLYALAQADATYTLTQIHTLVPEASRSGLRVALNRLINQGVVVADTPTQTVSLYSLNRSHLLTEAILAIANTRNRFLTLLAETISGWDPQPHLVSLYGSAARGDMHVESDIDLLIVAPESVYGDTRPAAAPDVHLRWEVQIASLTDLVEQATGNMCQVVEMTYPEWVAKSDSDDPLLVNVGEHGITITPLADRGRHG